MKKLRFGKWVGFVSTVTILVLSFTPGTFNIPGMLRPWIFLGSIIWFLVFATGVLSS
jgi:hypothetical protein